jgi:hypothetical protein
MTGTVAPGTAGAAGDKRARPDTISQQRTEKSTVRPENTPT